MHGLAYIGISVAPYAGVILHGGVGLLPFLWCSIFNNWYLNNQ